MTTAHALAFEDPAPSLAISFTDEQELKTSAVGLFPTLPPVGVSISNLAKGACGEQRRHDSDRIRRTTDGGKLLESPAARTGEHGDARPPCRSAA